MPSSSPTGGNNDQGDCVAAFALAVTNSAQAISPAPLHHPDAMITQVAFGCEPFRNELLVSA